MATNSNSSSNSKSSSNNSSSKHSCPLGTNKVSFYTICAVAILYLVSAILGACGVNLKIISALQGLATAMLIIIASINAWKYVAHKQTIWKVMFLVCLLVVVLGIILPLVV